MAIHSNSLSNRLRVIGALILRDIGSRHGGEGSGQFYLIIEPMVILTIIIGFHLIGGGKIGGGNVSSYGIPLLAFVLTGYPQHMMLRHTGIAGVAAINSNSALLYHQQVVYLDLVMSRLVLEAALVILGLFILYMVSLYFGMLRPPVDMGFFYLGWLFQIWFAYSVAFIFTGLGQIWHVVRRMFIPFAFIMLPFYGVFIMAAWLSPQLRFFFLLSPPFNATEMIRRGYVGFGVPTYFSIPYTAFCCLVLTFIGLSLMQHARRNFIA